MNESKKFNLNKQDAMKIADGAVIAVCGALLTYATSVVMNTNFGTYTPIVVALFGILANTIRKLLQGDVQDTPVTPTV